MMRSGKSRIHRIWTVTASASVLLFACMGGASLGETAAPGACACKDSGSVDGIHAIALLTSDQYCLEKWNTPPEEAVQFNTIGRVGLGETAILLAFFSNPMLRDGSAEVACDLRVVKPDGAVLEAPASPCYSDKFARPVEYVQLAGLRVEEEVEPTDPAGLWVFEVGVRDVIRNARVPLQVSLIVDPSQEPGQ